MGYFNLNCKENPDLCANHERGLEQRGLGEIATLPNSFLQGDVLDGRGVDLRDNLSNLCFILLGYITSGLVKARLHIVILETIFVALPNATFVTLKCKLAAISLRFRVRCLLQFPKNRRQVESSFEHVRSICNIAATNRTEIALESPLVLIHARCNGVT